MSLFKLRMMETVLIKESIRKAIKNGVVTEADANRLTDREVFDLIFQPGFSTAEVVSIFLDAVSD